MTTIDAYVEQFGLRRLLSPDLVELLRPLRREPGELIVRSGDPSHDLLFLVEGSAKVYSVMGNGHSILVAFHKPFEVLGDVELFMSDHYSLTVEALSDTICLTVPTDAVKKASDRNCRLLSFLCGRLGRKLAHRNLAESINLRYPVENRLASYLLATAGDDGLIIGTDNLGEIADFIGASYRQLSRVVRRFRDSGILSDVRNRIVVLDRNRLLPLAPDRYDQMT